MAPQRTTIGSALVAIAALVGAATLAGCTTFQGGGNQAPDAKLEADRTKGWNGDEYVFDAQASSDPDGNITEWAFDFGDGEKQTVHKNDDARVKHTYKEGGDYTVTVTVADDGRSGGLEKKSDSASVGVVVNERMPVAGGVIYAAPLNGTAAGRLQQPFEVNDGADSCEVTLTMQSVLLVGSSQARIRIMDPSGSVIAEKTVTLPATGNQTVELQASLRQAGNHTLDIEAQSGGASVSGEIRVLYG
jgi:PKD repeat protein